MSAYSEIYQKLARMSGVCPIVSVVLGPCIGGAALLTQLGIKVNAHHNGDQELNAKQYGADQRKKPPFAGRFRLPMFPGSL